MLGILVDIRLEVSGKFLFKVFECSENDRMLPEFPNTLEAEVFLFQQHGDILKFTNKAVVPI